MERRRAFGVWPSAALLALGGAVVCALLVSPASADIFGTGGNQFAIGFVPISGATNPASGIPAGARWCFTGVVNDYRTATCEITNDQWNKFMAELGVPVTGNPSGAYDNDPYWTGTNVPTNCASWYEAAQFVNWLNTSTGHQAAYKFSGTQGTSDYTLDIWSPAEADNGTNLYRHKNAFYYLPTEDEWAKAGYWNGTALQTYATKPGDTFHQGGGTSGTGWNYYDDGYATNPPGPWNVGSGSEELNGTFDMMGNVWEWMESPDGDMCYSPFAARALRGGSYNFYDSYLASSYRGGLNPYSEDYFVVGFRVAAEVPEPATVGLLAFGLMPLLAARRSGRRRSMPRRVACTTTTS
jgi:formylglycine-generating enzyme required for sulfatase activity